MLTATVKLLSLPYDCENGYSYKAGDDAFVGAFVVVPFGAGNRINLGVITELKEEAEDGIAYKDIDHVFSRYYSLSDEMLSLCEYIANTTLCSFGDAVRTVFPTAILGTVEEIYEPTDKPLPDLNAKMTAVYMYIASKQFDTKTKLVKELGAEVNEAIYYLLRNGYISRRSVAKGSSNVLYDEYYSYLSDVNTRSETMNAVVSYLKENGRTERSILSEKFGVSSQQLKSLCEKGAVTAEKVKHYRTVFAADRQSGKETLTDEQKTVSDGLKDLLSTGKPEAALLYGITGSGKTLVIKTVCDEVIKSGRQVIMLVPEISLTPQSIRVFSSFYGDRIAVLHSSLSEGERFDAWRRIKDGEVDIVIGTRSASFAPVPDLGLFVIDEEQETTYKSESSPKYRAKDVARFRCGKNNALMLLSSATPSLESFYKAKTGKYSMFTLRSRYGDAKLPEVVTADLRIDFAEGITDPLGTELCRLLNETYRAGNQSILFLNRRGYSNYITCKMCGNVIMCPRCDVSLTYHKVRGSDKGKLMCHYCGHTEKEPDRCPKCGSEHIGRIGYGTQKIDEQLATAVPGARVLRLDADTTAGKNSYDRILGEFRAHQADILIGTQMVTKGHDFPGVTLVGVVMTDTSLYLDDYRAHERTFSLLTQVIGRAGRGDKKGIAVIQTFNPEHEIIELSKKQDYDGFYDGEIRMRESLLFPPFCDILLFSLQSDDEVLLRRASAELKNDIENRLSKEYKDVKMLIYGPCEMQIFRMNGICRMQLLCKLRMGKRERALAAEVIKTFMKKYPRKVGISADVNPNQM
ncbi:MAG: primosomal protein N' [Clostridia bacterium]|nr:primosomal protein N' [Clostridia bacterium]